MNLAQQQQQQEKSLQQQPQQQQQLQQSQEKGRQSHSVITSCVNHIRLVFINGT